MLRSTTSCGLRNHYFTVKTGIPPNFIFFPCLVFGSGLFVFSAKVVQTNHNANHNGDYTQMKSTKYRHWDNSDVRSLKSMAKKKTPAPKIAKALRRTEGATRQKAFALGVSLESRF